MDSNIQKTKEYFNSKPKYFRTPLESYPILYKDAAEKINKQIQGNVIDIGSAETINYDTSKIKTLILADITNMNKEKAQKNIFLINSDIRKLAIKRDSIDFAIIQHTLHHLADNTLKTSLQNLNQGLQESYDILKRGGKSLIIEGVISEPFYILQKILFPINKRLYKILFNHPMVLQYSERQIYKELKKVGFKIEHSEIIKTDKFLGILGIKIPRWFIPIRYKFIIAVKE